MEFIEVKTTTEKRKDAKKIAEIILEKRFAGCIQINKIESSYWWDNKKIETKEWLLTIKTKKSIYKKLEKELKKIHPYKNPEIIATPIVAISKNYAKWLKKEIKD